MLHSTITKKGQTTIPNEVRAASNIQPGDWLEYKLAGKKVSMQVHPGTRSLAGALASNKGRDLSFSEIRKAAQAAARKKHRHDKRRLLDTNLIISIWYRTMQHKQK